MSAPAPSPSQPSSAELVTRRCQPMRGQPAMTADEASRLLPALDGWEVDQGALCKRYRFNDFAQTLGFVNALGWMANQQDHHPELQLSYASCTVRWSTHDVGGISMNDFICAARTDALR
jgi:4a-hydroxytetrahydrobiopterin dehydratase